MEIPEIILNFGQHLQRGDLVSSVRVCRTWNQVLTPEIYRTIDEDLWWKPPFKSLERNGPFLRSLTLSLGDSNRVHLYRGVYRSIRCRNLRELNLEFVQDDREDPHQTKYCLDLVSQNPNLHRLSISGHYPGEYDEDELEHDEDESEQEEDDDDDSDWKIRNRNFDLQLSLSSILELLPNLKSLSVSVKTLVLFRWDLEAIIALAPQLEKLSFRYGEGCWGHSSFGQHPQFPVLRNMTFENYCQSIKLLTWLENSPNICSLTWIDSLESEDYVAITDFSIIESRFHQLVIAPVWSQIQSLHLEFRHTDLLSDQRLSIILAQCAPLRKIIVPGALFWFASFFALKQRHVATLEDINLRYCPGIRSWMVQRLLSSCPRLISIKASPLHASELVVGPGAVTCRLAVANWDFARDDERWAEETRLNGSREPFDRRLLLDSFSQIREGLYTVQPWVCLNLESMWVDIHGVQTHPSWRELVIRRIAALPKLSRLCVQPGGPVFFSRMEVQSAIPYLFIDS
ncbi:hypothetical protein BGZ83_007318 [Gryganskiella cystojenkinii]|nr:hypothetical protein BGZ83_007318 [Gryganskiella cystojenkinii]